MLLAKGAKTAAEAGLNPFVFGKSARYAKNFSDEELKKFPRSLSRCTTTATADSLNLRKGWKNFSWSVCSVEIIPPN